MGKLFFTFITLALLPVVIDQSVSAAELKSIYIREFSVEQGLKPNDPTGKRIKDYISETVVDEGGYTIISDDEVKQIMKQEEMKMAIDSCDDDACIKKLMKSIRTDFIIYGNVSFDNRNYHVTAKILDRAGDTVKLARVKTLTFKDADKIKMASVDLARYLIDGKSIEMERYDDAYQAVIEAYEKKIPAGLSAYYLYFKPSKTPFKTYYDSLQGGGIDYYYNFGYYLSVFGGVSYMQGSDNMSGDATVSLNTYTMGGRFGYPLFGFMYPYIGLGGSAAWYNERIPGDAANFMGYGGSGFAGCAFIVWRTLTIWGDYSMNIMKLNDEADSNVSGSVIRGGLMYAF